MQYSPRMKTTLLWVLTVFITLSSVIYQRMSGPTYPLRGKVKIENEVIKFKLLRSHVMTDDALNRIEVPNQTITGKMRWRRYKSHDEWATTELQRQGDKLIARIPKQPAAGKIMYQIFLIDQAGQEYALSEEPVIIRFKGGVPPFVLIPHIIFIFASMLLGTRAGIEAIANRNRGHIFSIWTMLLMLLGGMILGPIVQKYAFDAYWTGWPFGHDLTDNKTLFSFVLWLVAIWASRKQGEGRKWIVIAAVAQLLVYLIPHSAFGSEIDHTKVQ